MSMFDPETQQFIPQNGTIAPSNMSAFSVFREFVNNVLGRTAKPFSEEKIVKKPIVQRVSQEDETQVETPYTD